MEHCPAKFNLARYVLRIEDRSPADVAMIEHSATGRAEWTWNDVIGTTLAVQRAVESRDSQPGDRVFIRLENGAPFAIAHLAVSAMGLVSVPVSPMLTSDEVAFLSDDAEPIACISSDSLPIPDVLKEKTLFLDLTRKESPERANEGAIKFADTDRDDPAYIVYTSGTTGDPRGVLHAHQSVWGRRPMFRGWTGLESGDTVVHAGSLNWTYTMGLAVYDAWHIGATPVVYTGPKNPRVWAELIESERATLFAAVPSVYRQLLKYVDGLETKLRSLKHGLTAGEALSETLRDQFRDITGIELFEALGMSECSTYVSTGPETPLRRGAVGRPQPGRRVAILPVDETQTKPVGENEVGMLAVHRTDPGLMLRYWRRPEATSEVMRGDWFLGGDLARMDADGYVYFEGRSNDLMNAFGYRVSPDEVEKAVERHPLVHEVGVVEARVRSDVSVICAYVVPVAGEHDLESLERELLEHAGRHLAEYKRPREVRFLSALPRTRSGKIQRRHMNEVWATR